MLILFFVVYGELHEVGFDETVDLAVHDAIHVAGLEIRAVVLYTLVIEDIRTDLTAPFYLFLARLDLRLGFQTLLHCAVVEL